MLPLFAGAIFLGAFLIFALQPMVAKMVLPSLGGSPAVWNTCMVFFQAALLAGYAYAHWATRRLGPRSLALVHAAIVLTPIATLPVALRAAGEPQAGSPILWLLGALALSVGLPFAVASTGAPLLQRWFSTTGHSHARDPYFLYAASNAGSLIALVTYPALVEPFLPLAHQRLAWSAGYVVLAAVVVACAVVTWRCSPVAAADFPRHPTPPPVPTTNRFLWLALAFVPSSCLLGVTQFLSTDIAAVPLLWVIPLALYLLTYVMAFARRPLAPVASLSRILPILVLGLAVAFLVGAKRPAWILMVLHLGAFFAGSLLCHARLAALRPHASRLTEFYLFVAVGGVLGGLFNALVAPSIFDTVVEYPIALALICLPRLSLSRPSSSPRWLVGLCDIAAGAFVLALALGLDLLVRSLYRARAETWDDVSALGLNFEQVRLLLVVGVPTLTCYLLVNRPARFVAGLAVLFWIGHTQGGPPGLLLHQQRTFFGVYRVFSDGHTTTFVHGTTEHGAQFVDPARRAIPLTYYHPDGPIGLVFAALGQDSRLNRAGFVGLGAGALAAYGGPGRRFTFFEIDPAVVAIAENPRLFTYMTDAREKGLVYDVILGDGRLSLRDRVGDAEFGLLVLDAFSSDAIPVHLITREAVALYMTRLQERGILAFHISNQYLSLAPVLSGIARDLGLVAYARFDDVDERTTLRTGRANSQWVLLARRPEDLAPVVRKSAWESLRPKAADPAWTDDFSNILGVFTAD